MKKTTLICIIHFIYLFSFADSLHVKPPLGFIENKGQIHDQNFQPNTSVRYLLNTQKGLNIQLKKNSFSYDVYRIKESSENQSIAEFAQNELLPSLVYEFQRIDVEFINANPNPIILAENPANDYLNYYNSVSPFGTTTNIKHFKRVVYQNLYPNIDLEFIIKNDNVKYNFIIKPQGKISDIKWKHKGTHYSELKNNQLILHTSNGEFYESIPLIYWQKSQKALQITYQKNNDFYSFKSNLTVNTSNDNLIIAPEPERIWGTYYGGTNNDNINSIKLDDSGNLYVTGSCYSSTAIATSGSHQNTIAGNLDVFIAKFNSLGVRQWGTYYGGTSLDDGRYIAVKNNFLIVSGYIQGSSSGIATLGAHQTNYGGGSGDAFIAKFSLNGVLEWGTYYGGSGEDFGFGCEIDSDSNIYLTAFTESTGMATSGAHQISYGGNRDGLLVKFNSSGVRQWATYYGDSGSDELYRVVVGNTNDVYVGGFGTSTGLSSPSAYQTNNAGGRDALLIKFSNSGVRQWATYYGGSGDEALVGLVIDNNDHLILTSNTNSTTGIATSGAYQTSLNGGNDAYLAKFNPNGGIIWSTYYGGTSNDTGFGLSVNSLNDIYLSGFTSSTGMATSGSHQATYGGGSDDGFLVKFNSSGVRQWATYYGGSNSDQSRDCVFERSSNHIYITGFTFSTNNISSGGSHQASYGGNRDGFIAKITDNPVALPVQLLYFNAKPNTHGVNLSWATASEINNDFFTIEKSINKIDWEIVKTVNSASNSSKISTYSTIDYTPYSDVSYYRLKQTYFDGKFEYSNIVSVNFNKQDELNFKIYPNPANTILYLLSDKEEYKIEIINALQQIVLTTKNQKEIDISSFTNGVYYIRVFFPYDNSITRKFIIQK
ncbi:MAG: T9SS type A sorting domain-containing protein [Raineya sp.]|jgi:hypothetical protein|nr:T9SS type A sorting domain-containing protein [Raineya sp.]